MKSTRYLLYAFTFGCTAALLSFMLSMLFSLGRPQATAVATAPAKTIEISRTPTRPSPDAVRVVSDSDPDLEVQRDGRLTEIDTSKHLAGQTKTLSPTAVATEVTGHAAEVQGSVAPVATEITQSVLPKRQPISETAPEGHIIASHLIGLEVGSEFEAILEGIGVMFTFVVVDASAKGATEMRGLHGHLRLDFVLRAGLPDIEKVFQRDPTLLRTIPLRIGRGDILLFEVLPDVTQPTSPKVASAIYADFVPLNLLEALPATGSAIDAPFWVEVDGIRTVLTPSETQHVLDVFEEAKRQHQLRWRAELGPGSSIRYVPK